METVVIVIHLMIVLALVLVVLLQRSEGGALGMGGGGFMSSRGTANVLTRATAILGVGFFITSIGLSLIAKMDDNPSTLLDSAPVVTPAAPITDGESKGNGILDALKNPQKPDGPQVPTAQ